MAQGRLFHSEDWCEIPVARTQNILFFKGEVWSKMNFTYVLGFVLLRDVVNVFPVSSPSFARKTTRKNRARSHSGAQRGLMIKWDLKLVA